jgi:hypothetical protein
MMAMTDEEAVTECQKEIRRLRGVVRDYEQIYSGTQLLKVKAEPAYPGDPIANVMTEMWSKAIALKADELSFDFNGRTVTIKQDRSGIGSA